MDDLVADLHIHSKYSHDSLALPEKIVRRAEKTGLTCIAVTDHGTIRGSVEARKFGKRYGIEVITGAEIMTDCGDIIGLGLNSEINSVQFQEVIREIRDQGGLVVLPHPYRGHADPEKTAGCVDFIEIWNSRSSPEENRKAALLAGTVQKEILYGSDAHCVSEIGSVRIRVKPETLEFREVICSDYCNPRAIHQSRIIHRLKKREFGSLFTEGVRFLWKKII